MWKKAGEVKLVYEHNHEPKTKTINYRDYLKEDVRIVTVNRRERAANVRVEHFETYFTLDCA